MPEISGRARIVARGRMARHAIRRARERFDLDLGCAGLRAVREAIVTESPWVYLVRANKRGREIWAVHMRLLFGRDIWVAAVFDRAMNSVVTFLEMSDA